MPRQEVLQHKASSQRVSSLVDGRWWPQGPGLPVLMVRALAFGPQEPSLLADRGGSDMRDSALARPLHACHISAAPARSPAIEDDKRMTRAPGPALSRRSPDCEASAPGLRYGLRYRGATPSRQAFSVVWPLADGCGAIPPIATSRRVARYFSEPPPFANSAQDPRPLPPMWSRDVPPGIVFRLPGPGRERVRPSPPTERTP